jgi:hypothetical protein
MGLKKKLLSGTFIPVVIGMSVAVGGRNSTRVWRLQD